ncbi:DUF882 domain-containing protein [Labrenzia aggregata]|uniref:Murein endopeptidase K n=1 Tax=Roseibium aggregatum TaxID=187304 RepID=A0A926S9N1_9HYPH|nr:DUF882 domain-containing protein [Roseibium aggregatum]MBD1547269.1 DUF882 domain-containing protein [Roseibium aggregatum]
MRKRFVGYDAVIGLKRALAFTCLLFALSVSQFAVADAEAETRTLHLYNLHTKERVSITFKKNGRYIPSALREANRFLRDWRRNEMTKIDPELLDLVWEVYQKVGATQPINVVSSYRSPATNNMLRSRSKGVAKHSQHMLGKAMDFFIPGVDLYKLRVTGLRKQVGGVGYYPTSGSPFVHMDTGSVRHWPRMTRSQLAKVFPDGKTLHIPSDGKPLSGYKLALAEARSGKSRPTRPTLVARAEPEPNKTTGQSLTNADDNGPRPPANLLASLFRSNDNSDTAQRSRVASVRPDNGPSLPEGVLPGVRSSQNSTPAGVPAPAPTAPPVPLDTNQIVLADIGTVPTPKPVHAVETRVQLASAAPVGRPAAPNTLEAQRVALEQGQTSPSASAPIGGRFNVASNLPDKDAREKLIKATQQAALAEASVSGRVPVPAKQPALDPVSAIAAATGTGTPATKPAAPTTLAYASATATAVPAGTNGQTRSGQGLSAAGNLPAKRPAPSSQSVSGRIPREEIKDPLAGFASLPDKSEPKLISGRSTTRNRLFASLRHPFQRSMNNLLDPGNRFVRGGFEKFPYGSLRTDRFDGPAVVVLPVTFAR